MPGKHMPHALEPAVFKMIGIRNIATLSPAYSAQPPSIRWVWPLMKADSSEAR